MLSVLIAVILGVVTVQASPGLVSRQSITTLTASQINAFTPYAYYAGAAYCNPAMTLSWNCGSSCNNNAGFKAVASGGHGDGVQYWYVGYDSYLKSVIVAHQGTHTSQPLALVTDLDLTMGGLDSSLFPGLPSDIKVHDGFRNDQSRTALVILSSVQSTMSTYGTTSVTLVGHSLGAALSLLDSVYLPLHLPSRTTFQTVLYGLPRVGNQAFADYVDSNLHVTHINNMKDPIPIVPQKFLGYVHPSGEVHIRETGDWVVCPGQDNPSKECTAGDVPTIFDGDLSNHHGPYNGIEIQCFM